MSSTGGAANVTVKLKRGSWEIEITCPEDRVQQAVESVLAGMTSKEPDIIEQPSSEEGERRFETCRGLLMTLWKEGWFGSPRALSEVHDEMSRRGYHYDRTAVAHTLVDLVREETLFRDGSARNYRYVQKRPLETPKVGPNPSE
jgi:secreted Zn-dependent insulinase-like peptidase